jgi:hypothetical protein
LNGVNWSCIGRVMAVAVDSWLLVVAVGCGCGSGTGTGSGTGWCAFEWAIWRALNGVDWSCIGRVMAVAVDSWLLVVAVALAVALAVAGWQWVVRF